MSQLHEIIYASQRSPGLTNAQIVDDIVLPSSRTNRDLDISGCLWFNDHRFLQVLEGPRDAVEQIYTRIEKDTRHHHVNLIGHLDIEERSFNRWGMRALIGSQNTELDELVKHYLILHGREESITTNSPGVRRVRGLLAKMLRHENQAGTPTV